MKGYHDYCFRKVNTINSGRNVSYLTALNSLPCLYVLFLIDFLNFFMSIPSRYTYKIEDKSITLVDIGNHANVFWYIIYIHKYTTLDSTIMSAQPSPLVLVILDGWGHRQETHGNAILAAHTPHWDALWRDNASTTIQGSGHYVGLPDGQMGNSEVGHLNLGAGRVVYQDFTRITQDIKQGQFEQNPILQQSVDHAINHDTAVHIMGLLSPGGVHSHEQHLHAMIRLAAKRGAKQIYVHAFLDGRDTPPRSAQASLVSLDKLFTELHCGQLVSLCGRYFCHGSG